MKRARLAFKALPQLGLRQSFWYAVYQLGLRSGAWKQRTPSRRIQDAPPIQPVFPIPTREELLALLDTPARAALAAEAEEICAGMARLFSGPPFPLELAPPAPLAHWTDYELGRAAWGVEDVKLLWEPARFGWAFTLGRAYQLTGDERLPAAFWQHFETFDRANPPNLGPNWASAQEAALRLLALVFAAQVFRASPASTPERSRRLAAAVLEHALRIPPTLCYARAQHNNHLVSEALGLYAAGRAMPAFPQAASWRVLGWRELNAALQSQIAQDGVYSQHSTNYHRLMLQAALLADCLARGEGREWPALSRERLAAATRWLWGCLDPVSGGAPNLGSNDGALILPLAPGGFGDQRPTLQAAARAFLNGPCLPAGAWDELGLWLGQDLESAHAAAGISQGKSLKPILRLESGSSWASLRAQRFSSRPSHADQLHVEVWCAGENLALDAGSYRYTAPPPWDNRLAGAPAHNTVTVDDRDPMTRAGKFLWLDWAQATVLSASGDEILAEHDGYRRLGILHRRRLRRTAENAWTVTDWLLPLSANPARHIFRLHWLLPDWPLTIQDGELSLQRPISPRFSFTVAARAVQDAANPLEGDPILQIIHGGQAIYGPPAPSPILGWRSPTYNLRIPAVSLLLSLEGSPPVKLETKIVMREE